MQLKTVSSIGLAFLLVVGVVGVASAQEVAATPGIFIRVLDRPPNVGRDRRHNQKFGSCATTAGSLRVSVWRWLIPADDDD